MVKYVYYGWILNQIASIRGGKGISSEMLQMVVSLVIAGLHPAIVAQLIVEFVILGIFGSLQCYALHAGLRARDLKRRQQAKVILYAHSTRRQRR